ncbi:isopenicillin N synthase family oxygenase [Roseateles sp. DAIF2]|uniref:isopenicillin N synthase family dioxygenase n=1 Tax=Roseateles sp. DAIF2 TaxID=2714952 RepID=UPI0018A24E65|nr:isopenicillin N synthase family oxygenase [Roseateles sp. DAIF2]QPF76280.1 isopenicillin N synthase family oxygenase [Roseateles sp. DAIF2]
MTTLEDSAPLPLLDLRDFADPATRAPFVARLREAAHGAGFFYLRGHGLTEREQAELLRQSRAFFALPRAVKQALHMANSPHFRGYTAAGDEITRGARDWREQLDIGAERAPLPESGAADAAWRRLQGPNQWPAELPTLRPCLLDWQQRLTEVGLTLLRALALALEQPEARLAAAFEGAPVQHLKIIRYPGRQPGDSDQGVGPHKDSGCLTLLLQDRQGGLQVQREPGAAWSEVPPLPGSLVVNLGEVLEILSDGFLRATRHRVVSPPAGVDRLSVAFFLGPRLDAQLPALPLPPALAARARGIEQDPLNPLLDHAGRNFLKGRLRSHPEVARAFYADVTALG